MHDFQAHWPKLVRLLACCLSRAREKPPQLHARHPGRQNKSRRPSSDFPLPASPPTALRRDEAVLQVLEDDELILGVLGLVVLLEQRVGAAQLVRRVEVDLVVFARE